MNVVPHVVVIPPSCFPFSCLRWLSFREKGGGHSHEHFRPFSFKVPQHIRLHTQLKKKTFIS